MIIKSTLSNLRPFIVGSAIYACLVIVFFSLGFDLRRIDGGAMQWRDYVLVCIAGLLGTWTIVLIVQGVREWRRS